MSSITLGDLFWKIIRDGHGNISYFNWCSTVRSDLMLLGVLYSAIGPAVYFPIDFQQLSSSLHGMHGLLLMMESGGGGWGEWERKKENRKKNREGNGKITPNKLLTVTVGLASYTTCLAVRTALLVLTAIREARTMDTKSKSIGGRTPRHYLLWKKCSTLLVLQDTFFLRWILMGREKKSVYAICM